MKDRRNKEVMGRRGSRSKQLLDATKEKRRYWKFKGEARDCFLCKTRFSRGYGPMAKQTKYLMN
jgi:hypothetical protein